MSYKSQKTHRLYWSTFVVTMWMRPCIAYRSTGFSVQYSVHVKKLLFTPYWGWQWGPLFAISESMPSQWQTEKQELINCISKFQLQFYPGFSSRITQLPQLWLHTTCNIYRSSLRQEKCCLCSSMLFFPKLCPPTYNCWGEGEEEKRKKEAKEARFVDISPL